MARKTEFQRFVEKIRPPKDPVRDCWEWLGERNQGGYGRFKLRGGVRTVAHRHAFNASHLGPLVPGMKLDHLCRNRACVNPNHLDPVTDRENSARGLNGILRPGKTSRFVGVSWSARDAKWRAHTHLAGKQVGLGYFDSEEAAARAYRDFIEALDAK